MKSNKKCPICGCKNIREGKVSGYTNMIPITNFSISESVIIAEICIRCGQILSLKQKFSKI